MIYNFDKLNNLSDGDTISTEKIIKREDRDVDSASYLSINGDCLYVGNFETNSQAFLEKFDIDENGGLKYTGTYKVPFKKIQGMAVYNYNGEDYYIFSSSYGRENDSTLYIATLTGGKFNKQLEINMPCMSEGIAINKNNELSIVFESDCAKYGQGKDGNGKSTSQIQDICTLDIKSIIEENIKSQN